MALQGTNIVLFDTEQTKEEIYTSMACVALGKSEEQLTGEDLTELERQLYNLRVFDMAELYDLVYERTSLSVEKVEKLIDEQVALGVRVFVFDNVTRAGAEDSKKSHLPRMELMSMLSRKARQKKVLVLCLAHTYDSLVDTTSKADIEQAIESRNYNKLLELQRSIIKKPTPKSVYGGSARTQFDGTMILWRPFQNWADVSLQKVCWLLGESMRHVPSFVIDMEFNGPRHDFVIKHSDGLDSLRGSYA